MTKEILTTIVPEAQNMDDCTHHLDKIARIAPMSREMYGSDESNKPNDHCNWERLIPTLTSPFGWVENDEHFRSRIKERIG